MSDQLTKLRLLLFFGALAAFCGGLLHAITAWDAAADDRAYVAAAAQALAESRAPPTAALPLGWVPDSTARLQPAAELAMQRMLLQRPAPPAVVAPPAPSGPLRPQRPPFDQGEKKVRP